ncbi:RNA polymerase sigma factor [Acanthopleuribacter pedis]|uniref:RNA polymerase sigma factor n=1 Tax=Acanthopleuribacter pedis TaxID=442870 RepID=A0A8J7Q839_9BACT|nr:sigma-70 family RNA polymerase sigma factor [Acanthopleuribacter pedis]MBO1320176.1 sigma-70 family RNA polymerase sigma factor [Acanthopleuribacter pedis]
MTTTSLQGFGVTIQVNPQAIPTSEDQALVQRFLDGEESAFTQITLKYRKQVYAVAYRFTRNHAEADDLTQETFIRAYNGLANFRQEASLKTWLLKICTNLSINLTRSGRVTKDSGDAVEDHDHGKGAVSEARLIQEQRHEELYAAINQLPPKQKETLLLKTFQDMTCEEVAKIMKCSPGTVKANVFNAVKKLRTLLKVGVNS